MPESSFSGEITINRSFNGLTVGTTFYQQGTINDAIHSHDAPTICFLLAGGGVEKRNRNSYERLACDIKFYHGAELHQSIIKVFPSKCLNLELNNQFLNRYEISENTVKTAVGKHLDVKFSMLKAYNELLVNDNFTDTSIEILLLGLLDGAASGSRKKPDWIKTLHELLNDRWADQPSLEELSLAVKVHPTTISKYFTRYFSCTLGEYMRKLKINKSIFLIRNSKLSLTEIACLCGFADQSHFIRNFKNLTGFLPKDFRRL